MSAFSSSILIESIPAALPFFMFFFITCQVIHSSLTSISFGCLSLTTVGATGSGQFRTLSKYSCHLCLISFSVVNSFPSWSFTMFILHGRSLHNVFVTSCTSFRLLFLAATSASLANAFAHSLLSALKLLFTCILFSFFLLSFLILSLPSSSSICFFHQFCSNLFNLCKSCSFFVYDQELTLLFRRPSWCSTISLRRFQHSGCHCFLFLLIQFLPSS